MQSEAHLTRTAVLDTALRFAERSSWDALHLYDVARELGVELAEIQRHYGDKDRLAEALFDRADAALFRAGQRPGWRQLPLRQRLHDAIAAWLAELAPHRRVVREMLGYKLQPEHVHLQVMGVMRISRTVQWIREVALVSATGWRRELAEAVLTSTYLAVFAHWLFDESEGAQRTHRLLDALLRGAERGAKTLAYPS